jgi:hypothetical protein
VRQGSGGFNTSQYNNYIKQAVGQNPNAILAQQNSASFSRNYNNQLSSKTQNESGLYNQGNVMGSFNNMIT